MRLNKFMASCGVAARRQCDQIIESGRVRVNAVVVKKLGTKIDPKLDIVAVDGKPIRLKGKFEYIMLYKPTGYVTTVRDPQGRKTVLDLLPMSDTRLYPIGRLDYNTSGLLLITNDGDLAQKLTHPSFEMGKTYIALLNGNIGESELGKLRAGLDIGGFVTSPAEARLIRGEKGMSEVQLTIHEGKNRQVRRMFAALGAKVKALKRIAVGTLSLGNLREGQWRDLTDDEIHYLKNV